MTIKKLKALLDDSIESRSRISLHPSFDDIDAQIALSAIERLEQIASDAQRLLDLANSAEKWKGIALAKHGSELVSQIEQDKADAVAAEREACARLCDNHPDPEYSAVHIECASAIRARGRGLEGFGHPSKPCVKSLKIEE